jgi:PKD repeat protein
MRKDADSANGWRARRAIPAALVLVALLATPSSVLGENQAPYVDGSPDAAETDLGNELCFTAERAYDPDGDDLTYFWDFGDGYTTEGEFDAYRINFACHTYADAGVYTVTITVSDGSLETTDSMTATVNEPIPGEAPVAFIDAIAPNPADEGTPVDFSGHGEDADGTVVGYLWTSDVAGDLSTEQNFTTDTLSAGFHTISFSVQDNDGAWSDEVSALLTISLPGDPREDPDPGEDPPEEDPPGEDPPIDRIPPTVIIGEPTVDDSKVALMLDVSDENGVDSVRCTNAATGETVDASDDGAWRCTLALSPGENPVEVEAVDRAGNSVKSQVSVYGAAADDVAESDSESIGPLALVAVGALALLAGATATLSYKRTAPGSEVKKDRRD